MFVGKSQDLFAFYVWFWFPALANFVFFIVYQHLKEMVYFLSVLVIINCHLDFSLSERYYNFNSFNFTKHHYILNWYQKKAKKEREIYFFRIEMLFKNIIKKLNIFCKKSWFRKLAVFSFLWQLSYAWGFVLFCFMCITANLRNKYF